MSAALLPRWRDALRADLDSGLTLVRAELLAGADAASAGKALALVLSAMLAPPQARAVERSMRADMERSLEELAGEQPELRALAERVRARRRAADQTGLDQTGPSISHRIESLAAQRREAAERLATIERQIEAVTGQLARARARGAA